MQLEDLEDILEQAQGRNAENQITGALVYVDGSFLQILEGEKESVETLMQVISRDLRHETIAILQSGEIPCAAFTNWKMAYVSATPEQIARWAGLSSETRLPELWEDIRQEPHRATQVARSLLSVLTDRT